MIIESLDFTNEKQIVVSCDELAKNICVFLLILSDYFDLKIVASLYQLFVTRSAFLEISAIVLCYEIAVKLPARTSQIFILDNMIKEDH